MTNGSNGDEDAQALETYAAGKNGCGRAHHLLNLVQVVSGYMELLAGRTQDELSLRYLETAQTATQEITELAQSLAGNPEAQEPQALGG